MFSTIRVQGNWYLLVICFQIRLKKMNQCVMFWSCDNCRIHKHFSFLVSCLGRKNIHLFCLRDESIHTKKEFVRLRPIDVVEIYFRSQRQLPPSRAPVCSVKSVSVRIYQQNEMRKTQRSWLRPFLFLTTTGSLGFQSFTNIS